LRRKHIDIATHFISNIHANFSSGNLIILLYFNYQEDQANENA